MRVLHLITYLEPGGIENWLLDMLHLIPSERCQMDFCCKGPHVGRRAQEALDAGSRVVHCPLGPDHARFVRGMRRALNQRPYDIVHVHLGTYSGIGVWAAHRAGLPAIATFHSTRLLPQTWTRLPVIRQLRAVYSHLSVRYAVSRAEIVTATSRATLRGLDPAFEADDRYRVTRVGVASIEPADAADRARIRQEMGWAKDAPVLLHVGSFREAKNHLGLIDLFEIVAAERPDARLLMVGDGRLRPRIERRVRQLGLEARARCVGVRSDVATLMAASNVLVLPSLYEGFGRVAVEAGAAGVPVVGSRVDGLVEAVTDGVTGLLHPVGDTRAMAASVLRLLADPEMARRLGEAGRARAQDEYSLEASARGLLESYDDCLRRHHPVRRHP